MKNRSIFLGTLALLWTAFSANAQEGFGTNSPAPSSVVDMVAADKGVLLPRVALTGVTDVTTIASPATALTVFNTATAGMAPDNVTPGYYYWSGAPVNKWIRLMTEATASNGLNIGTGSQSDKDVKLGGALINPTVISGLTATNSLSISGTGTAMFNVDGTTLSVDGTNDRVGIGTAAPSERLDIGSGNVRIRDINSNIGVGGVDRSVVVDANGVLKVLNPGAYTVFHARLAANQTHTHVEPGVITTLRFAAPLTTTPIYSYDTTTGTLTFNEPGNYLITMQASFANVSAGGQLVLGVRPVPDAPYLGRGSHYSAVNTGSNVGELMNYTTMIVVPNSAYNVRFVAAPNNSCTILANETGSTGTGNVTNITIQKI